MFSFNTLPFEIRQLIFQHVDSTEQLGECRLVCRMWDEPAECAMFSRQLLITENNVKPLYQHLITKPSRAKHIKEINFDCRLPPELTAALLRSAITPSIEITSDIYSLDKCFYQVLAQMVRDNGMRLERLKSIPWPYRFKDIHHQTALLLKDSLQEMKIPANSTLRPHEVAKHLSEFKHLSKLQVDCNFDSLPQVESVFDGARHLMEIELRGCHFNKGNVWTYEQRLQWMKQHVKINDNPIALNVDDDENLGIPLIEYFLFKYPNTRQLDYDARGLEMFDFEEVDFNAEINAQACAWISRIPKFNMMLNSYHGWRTHYGSFAGDKNVFWLNYGEAFKPKFEETQVSSIEEQDGKKSTQFEFWVKDIYAKDFLDTHVAFLQDIGTFTTHMHMCFLLSHATESEAFFRALEVMQKLEKMKLVSSGNLESVDLDLPPQYSKRQIDTLEISRAQIQPQVFHTLDQLFHTITTLELLCCPITKDKTNTVYIHMPSTTLGKLIMNTEFEHTLPTADFEYNYESEFQDMLLLSEDTYLTVNLQQKVTLYFTLKPSSKNVQQVSMAEYTKRPRHATAFTINCQLLTSIEVNLGDIRATIDVQKYCEGLGVAFN